MTLYDALKLSVNTIAVRISLDVGREKVTEVAHRIGLASVKKTCSMALGDANISPLEHTAGFAVFANGGKAVKPYAILELRNTHDELVYSRERDEPPPAQIFKREDIEILNTMLEKVVSEGTGTAAKLDFTVAAGHSSGPKDVWSWAFPGQYALRLVRERRFQRDGATPPAVISAPTGSAYGAAHTSMDIRRSWPPQHPRRSRKRQRWWKFPATIERPAQHGVATALRNAYSFRPANGDSFRKLRRALSLRTERMLRNEAPHGQTARADKMGAAGRPMAPFLWNCRFLNACPF
jgi:penicillin-binding protein 1A